MGGEAGAKGEKVRLKHTWLHFTYYFKWQNFYLNLICCQLVFERHIFPSLSLILLQTGRPRSWFTRPSRAPWATWTSPFTQCTCESHNSGFSYLAHCLDQQLECLTIYLCRNHFSVWQICACVCYSTVQTPWALGLKTWTVTLFSSG